MNKGLQAQLLRKGTQLLFGKVVAKVQLVWIVSVSLCPSDSGSLFLASPQNHRPKHTLVTEMEAALLTDRNQPPVSRRSRVHECRPPSGFTSPPSALCDTFSGRSRLSAKSRSNLFFFLHFRHHLIWGEIVTSRHVWRGNSDSTSVAKHFSWRDTSRRRSKRLNVTFDLWPAATKGSVDP